MRRVMFSASNPTYKRLAEDAAIRGIAVSELVRRILDAYYSEREEKQ